MKNILRRAERGSALFLILIAVALFAALGYAVSTMMQGGSSTNIGDEKASLYAGEVLDYARTMRQTIQAMRIDGCRDSDISFENPIEGGYVNGTDTDCQVFHPDGGGMSWVSPSNGINDGSEWVITGDNDIDDVGSTGGDLSMFLRNIESRICDEINDISGITALGSDGGVDFTPFTGAFSATEIVDSADGQAFGCLNFDNGGVDEPFFYQVLIAR